MSFGSPASGPAARRIAADAPCPCGSGVEFAGCCSPLLQGEPSTSAERLMRSRYTAFALGDAAHLERTWHPRTRPQRVEPDAALEWTGLRIVATEAGGASDVAGVVEFVASWAEPDGTTGALHERSAFARRGGRWLYVEGEVDGAGPADPGPVRRA